MEQVPEVMVKEVGNAVRMDIVMSEAAAPKPACLESPTEPTVTVEEIQKKLEDAAIRRHSLMSEKQASLAARISKIEETHKRKEEIDQQFIKSTKEALEQKLEAAEENKIKLLNDLKTRVKEELEKIMQHHQSKENEDLEQAKSLMDAIQEKLETAAANRDQNLQAVVKRLKDHEEAVNRCLTSQKEQLDALKDKINSQLEKAAENRNAKLQEIKDAAKEHDKKVDAIKQKKEGEEN
ncbi:unnamed protein product [Notodromas monacha]|uniref:Stathmin n=1 Tax=Notodromas monacha TaxID=399045 RepID=A0A7R9BDZ1_9CRUS|nr:unnamed protein product [Notodromas monacha]CAG0913631.1 unnamed protein product [Notodromas monacha]